jgi:GWxTD domain-containing protein
MDVLILAAALASTPLSERHKAWLEEEAAYIITSREKDLFLKLPGEDDRERFIAAFWEARDPTPGTRRNEFKEEHGWRRREANRLFRGYGREGWKTERGRIFILLGAPRERKSLDRAGNRVWPIELWFYQLNEPPLPGAFYLLFYRRGGVGDYRLWDPFVDGPGELLVSETMNPVTYDPVRAGEIFLGIDSDLYQAVTAPTRSWWRCSRTSPTRRSARPTATSRAGGWRKSITRFAGST